MRNFKTQGIVIKRRDFNEADRLITVYTQDQGKIHCKAQGVRRITSRRSSHIELLNFVDLSLYKAHQIPILIEAHVLNSFSAVKENLEKTGLAYHLCELIDGLCPDSVAQPEVFTLFKNTLNELALSEKEDFIPLIHDFEVNLLTYLGFWNSSSSSMDTHDFIEGILERRLKSHRIFSKIH